MKHESIFPLSGLSEGEDPTAYLIRGAVIALRQADAARIEVGGAP